jgi:asparagine synthase (glutamine-hydrolysing)
MVLSRATSKKVKVVLTGEGADEILGGYPWYHKEKLYGPLLNLPPFMRALPSRIPFIRNRWSKISRSLLTPRQLSFSRVCILIDGPRKSPTTEGLFSEPITRALETMSHENAGPVLPKHFESWHPFTRMQYFDIKVRMADSVVRHLDRLSMAYSLEARVPFLDHEFVEFCAAIPPHVKMKRLVEKNVLRRALTNDLPPEIINRRKWGFRAPVHQWMRKDLPEFAREMLSERQIKEKGYFNSDCVGRMLSLHRAGIREYGRQLIGVLGIQIWDDIFINGHKLNAPPC